MDVTRKSRVMDVIADTDMRDVLAWYGLPVDDRSYFRYSLEDFCEVFDIDVEDVLVELSVTEVEAEQDDWDDELSNWLSRV